MNTVKKTGLEKEKLFCISPYAQNQALCFFKKVTGPNRVKMDLEIFRKSQELLARYVGQNRTNR